MTMFLRFIKLHTAYFNAEGILVTAPVKCAVNYFKTNFLLDLISNFPTELISLAIWNGGQCMLMRELVYHFVVMFAQIISLQCYH